MRNVNLVAAAVVAAGAAAVAVKEHIDNTELVAAFNAQGGRVLHLRPGRRWDGSVNRGVTIAFIAKGHRVQIATAITHPNDDFCKKNGTKTAITHFNEGKTVFLPVDTRGHVIDILRDAFHQLL